MRFRFGIPFWFVVPLAVFAQAQTDYSKVQIKANKLADNLYTLDGAGGTIGAHASRGHGRLKLYLLDEAIDLVGAVEAYHERVRETKDEAIAWLGDVFALRAVRAPS